MIKLQPLLTPRQKLSILFFDGFIFLGLMICVFRFRMGFWEWEILRAPAVWFVLISTLTLLYIFGAYDLDSQIRKREIYVRTSLALVMALLIIILVNYLSAKERMGLFGRGILLGTMVLFWSVSVLYRRWIWQQFKQYSGDLKWLFFSTRPAFFFFKKEMSQKNILGQFSFLLPSAEKDLTAADSNLQVVGTWSDYEKFFKNDWSGLVVAAPWSEFRKDLVQGFMLERWRGKQIFEFSDFYERVFRKVPVDYLNPEWFVTQKGFHLLNNPLGLRIKRLVDLFLALFILLVTWPLMLITFILVKLESPGPAIYSQIRAGQGGRQFRIHKFRSMHINAESGGAQWAQKNDSRVTRVGRFIRLTRLDELPQLINIIRGEMSFIGPRPERPEFNAQLEAEIPFFQLRLLVRPGLTGWAQVCYPYGASTEDSREKLKYDLYYIKNQSLLFDFQIVLRTIKVVFFGQGR